MRIVFDLQATQTSHRHRGIGRYTLSLVKAFANLDKTDQLIFLFNGVYDSCIAEVVEALDGEQNVEISVWYPPKNVGWLNADHQWLRERSEDLYSAFVSALNPDILVVASLFEGLEDDAIISIPDARDRKYQVAVVLYDLIPLIHERLYLDGKAVRAWYFNRLEHLKRADHLLSISESSRQEVIRHLGFPSENVTNISSAIGEQFKPLALSREDADELRNRLGIVRSYLMYTGGIDHRKNIDGLIRAYSKLPSSQKALYQLVIVCAISEENRLHLQGVIKESRLNPDDVVLTGYVSEEDLVNLYNLSTAFVFPSWHEGFGLPVLEAMACGKAVIGSNASSIPEVIGCDEALFAPRDDAALTQKIMRLLQDEAFRNSLEIHARVQAAKFSWEKTARCARDALGKLQERFHKQAVQTTSIEKRRLAFVTPLPPEKSGIADYSLVLLPALSAHYDIEVIVSQPAVDSDWVNAHLPIRDSEWLVRHADRYDRVVYNFGNSTFHAHMLALLQRVPGVVILHDFFLSGLLAHLECTQAAPSVWKRALYESHGYKAVADRINADDIARTIWQYPANLGVINQSLGIIVHSEHAVDLAKAYYGKMLAKEWQVIPLVRQMSAVGSVDRFRIRKSQGLPDDAFVVCTFGFVNASKLPDRLLDAWNKSELAVNPRCFLFFVGENSDSRQGRELAAKIEKSPSAERIQITGWTSPAAYADFLLLADLGVQLRTKSRGETSAAVLDCMNYGLPAIVNAHGSMAYLNRDTVWMIPDNFSDEELVSALNEAYGNPAERLGVSQSARVWMQRFHAPETCAAACAKSIERLYSGNQAKQNRVLTAAGGNPKNESDINALADAFYRTSMPAFRQKQLLVDVSELIKRDSKSGIQRVVKGVLREWLNDPPLGYRVEPVYAVEGIHGYRYARNFSMKLLNCSEGIFADDPLLYAAGDVFFGLDLQPWAVPEQSTSLELMKLQGVKVYFMVYDLLPILKPEYFHAGADAAFRKWLRVVLNSNGVICESQAVADDLQRVVQAEGLKCAEGLQIMVCHIGADEWLIPEAQPVPEDFKALCKTFEPNLAFLMVGTLEPRKGHALVLEAFTHLWRQGSKAMLVIVGKHGWMVDELAERIASHPMLNKQLFWLQDVPDGQLEALYNCASALIAASEAEGFGLPIIEASQRGLAVIARDIPVFREVAGEYAYYVSGRSAAELADDLTTWMALFQDGRHPRSQGMPWRSWELVAKDIAARILGG